MFFPNCEDNQQLNVSALVPWIINLRLGLANLFSLLIGFLTFQRLCSARPRAGEVRGDQADECDQCDRPGAPGGAEETISISQ